MTLHPYGAAGALLDLTDTTPRTQDLAALVAEMRAEVARLDADLRYAENVFHIGYKAGRMHTLRQYADRLTALTGGTP